MQKYYRCEYYDTTYSSSSSRYNSYRVEKQVRSALSKEVIDRMSFLERKNLVDHYPNRRKIEAIRLVLRLKRKKKNKSKK